MLVMHSGPGRVRSGACKLYHLLSVLNWHCEKAAGLPRRNAFQREPQSHQERVNVPEERIRLSVTL